MKLEQAFYGRGPFGYGILGASSAEGAMNEHVATLCQSVGTPGMDGGDAPFLLQQTFGGRVYMVCGRNGAPDATGRRTLFFHALVALESATRGTGLSAADLHRKGLFAKELPDKTVSPLHVDPGVIVATSSGNTERLRLPAVIACRRSANLDVLPFLEQSGGGSWATFSWRPLRGFDAYGLDETISPPPGANVYDATGRLVQAAPPSPPSPEKRTNSPRPTPRPPRSPLFATGRRLAAAFFCILLGLGIGYPWGRSSVSAPKPLPTPSPEPTSAVVDPVSENTSAQTVRSPSREALEAELRPELERTIRNELEPKIRADEQRKAKEAAQATVQQSISFNEDFRIASFEEAMAICGRIPYHSTTNKEESIKKEQQNKRAKFYYDRFRAYVDFVNKNFPTQDKTKGSNP